MSMHTFPLNDDHYEEVTISKVHASEKSGGWSIERSDGWSFFVPKDSPVAPEVGMHARFYGKGIGYAVRGLFLNGQEVFYRTEEQEVQHEREERYGKDAAALVKKWDDGDAIWSIEMGGFGPNYELALQVAAIEFAREGLDVPLEGPKEGHDAIWNEVCDHAMERVKPWLTGLSGAQFGAAKWLAWQWVHGAGPGLASDAKYKDRAILVSKNLPATGPTAGVTGLPAPRVTRAADPGESDMKVAQREGYDEGWNDCLEAVTRALRVPEVQPAACLRLGSDSPLAAMAKALEAIQAWAGTDGVDLPHGAKR